MPKFLSSRNPNPYENRNPFRITASGVAQNDVPNAFAAGGDIRRLYEAGRSGDVYTAEFFRDEYRLNRRIHHYPKPFVALMSGVTMGGGVGISAHGSHRVVTERVHPPLPPPTGRLVRGVAIVVPAEAIDLLSGMVAKALGELVDEKLAFVVFGRQLPARHVTQVDGQIPVE